MINIEKIRKYFFAASLTFTFIILSIALASIPSKENTNLLTGHATSSKILVLNMENSSCQITLNQGWNLVSFQCVMEDNSIETYLASINGSISSIHAYDAFVELDKWKVYNPNLPSWVVNDLTSFKREEGYWINMESTKTVNLNGSVVKPTPIQLKRGWNLVGYTTNLDRNITRSLATNMGVDWSTVYMYNSSDIASPWKIFMLNPPPLVTLDFYNFTANYGYWINASKTGEWYINY